MAGFRFGIIKVILTAVAVILPLAGQLSATEIGLVTTASHTDAAQAEAILGIAYARTSNRFLVAADPTQITRLEVAGLAFEPVLEVTDLSDIYFVLSLDHPKAPPTVDLNIFGRLVDLGGGLRLMTMSQRAATSLSETSNVRAVAFTDRSVRFKFIPVAFASSLLDDYPSDSLADRISMDSLLSYDQRLQDFQTRYAYSWQVLDARDWLVSKFHEFGYSNVTTPSFYVGGWHYNVVAIKPGWAEPDKVIVIGGHYDSWISSGDPYTYAPGADDNGSGTSLTLEVARALVDIPLRKTVVFIAFAAEEIGLEGSEEAASNYANDGTKLEVMYNFDMVGYTIGTPWDIDIESGPNSVYRDLTAASAGRVSYLVPVVTPAGGSSDHYSFMMEGFNIVNHIESDFNTPGWHTALDLTSEMDFPYLTEVAKMSVASLAIVADGTYPVAVAGVVDIGDGQALEVHWTDCAPDCSYTVSWGTASGEYTNTGVAPPGQCRYTITGLETGTEYFILAIGEAPNGYQALYGEEGTATPYLVPQQPQNLTGLSSGDQLRLSLSWQANREADLSHYNVYRRLGDLGVFQLYQGNVIDLTFDDDNVVPHVGYSYRITAVDGDGYESVASEAVMLYPATFDGGIVIVDATYTENQGIPTQSHQEAWLDTVMGETGFQLVVADKVTDQISVSDVGRSTSLFWIDDDYNTKTIASSDSTLAEFAEHNTNIMLAGWKTFYSWSPWSVPNDHMLRQEFGLTYYSYIALFDFVGAVGQDGWPSVEIDPARGMDQWRDIARLSEAPGATVIYTYDSDIDYPDTEGRPVGLAFDTPKGKRLLLAFPLYNLTEASATALLAKAIEYFGGIAPVTSGDLDKSGVIDITDLMILLDHLFVDQEPLEFPALADVDGHAGVSIGDALYLANYLLAGGPAPLGTP